MYDPNFEVNNIASITDKQGNTLMCHIEEIRNFGVDCYFIGHGSTGEWVPCTFFDLIATKVA